MKYHFTQSVLTYMIALGFALTMYALIKIAIPESNRDVLLVLTGVLAGAFKDVVAYWIGSSRGSQAKDAALAATGKGGASANPGQP